jgi:hypothetical protein
MMSLGKASFYGVAVVLIALVVDIYARSLVTTK